VDDNAAICRKTIFSDQGEDCSNRIKLAVNILASASWYYIGNNRECLSPRSTGPHRSIQNGVVGMKENKIRIGWRRSPARTGLSRRLFNMLDMDPDHIQYLWKAFIALVILFIFVLTIYSVDE